MVTVSVGCSLASELGSTPAQGERATSLVAPLFLPQQF
jgi:hypothetical protein